MNLKTKTYVITSGFFNPLHSGHLALLKEAKELGDELIVIVNNDKQVKLKGSQEFMTAEERLQIVLAIKYVDQACISMDEDITVSRTIDILATHINKNGILNSIFGEYSSLPHIIFAKGGDRKNTASMPSSELNMCKKHNISVIYGVGGFDKKNSSSEILKKVNNVQNNNDINFVS